MMRIGTNGDCARLMDVSFSGSAFHSGWGPGRCWVREDGRPQGSNSGHGCAASDKMNMQAGGTTVNTPHMLICWVLARPTRSTDLIFLNDEAIAKGLQCRSISLCCANSSEPCNVVVSWSQ